MSISVPWGEEGETGVGRSRRRRRRPPAPVAHAAFGGGDRAGEWVTVFWAPGIEVAHVVRGALEAEDIPVMLQAADSSSVMGSTALHGVKVNVPAALEDHARQVLEGLAEG
jgi:hypothetical protein